MFAEKFGPEQILARDKSVQNVVRDLVQFSEWGDLC